MTPIPGAARNTNILFRRDQRLRQLTRNNRYRSKAELVKIDPVGIFMDAIVKSTEIFIKDPAIVFACVYGSLVYATHYDFFEAFPLVYVNNYHFTLGQFGLVFLCVIVGYVVCATMYAMYLKCLFGPESRRREMGQETCLRVALPAVFFLPIGHFIFAWTARW